MKVNHYKAEKERLAKVKFRRFIRRIPDNARLVRILLEIPDKPFRREFYRRAAPLLKFKPIPLEALDAS